MLVVDLAQPVRAGMPVFPGDPPVRVRPALTLAADGVVVHELHLGTHTGTHVDAPAHVLAGGATVDELPLAVFAGRLVLVRFLEPVPRHRFSAADVAERLPPTGPGDVVLIDTGWARFFDTDAVGDHPFLDVAVADLLLDRGIRAVGVDTSSPDESGDLGLEFHHRWAAAGGVIYENLVLSDLPDVEPPGDDGTWWFSGLPLRLAGLDGSPVRATAHRVPQASGQTMPTLPPIPESASA